MLVVWLLMALRWWGMGSSTLLGPEGSAVSVAGCSGPPFARGRPVWWLRVLVGLLFEICIVDASIFVVRLTRDCGWVVLFRDNCCGHTSDLCCCDVVETSYEGHMVDALASRADEGRWSLR